MSLPTKADVYEKLSYHMVKAQEASAELMMLSQAEGDGPGMVIARGWFHVSEALKKMQFSVRMLATKGRLH